jgi:hypothetical protein
MTLEIAAWFWFITAPVVIFAVVATVIAILRKEPVGSQRKATYALFYSFPLLCVAIGRVFEEYRAQWPYYMLYATILGLVVFVIVTAIRFVGQRLMATSHGTLALWLSLCASSVSAMSITGDWI